MRQRLCLDCDGRGTGSRVWLQNGLWGYTPCPTCDSAGYVDRTGPYRLTDGGWSDGVDRTHAIPSHEFSKANPDRVYVHTSYEREAFGSWQHLFDVWRGNSCIKAGWPFPEAIAYADRAARATQ